MQKPIDDIFMPKDDKDYKFFRNFMNIEEAQAFTKLLEEYNIPFKLETTGTVIDSVIVGNGLVPKAILKIPAEDFIRTNQIIADQLSSIDQAEINDHYLAQLDDDELKDILLHQDEWSTEDGIIAKLILKQRGKAISEEEIQQLRNDRFEKIKQGREGSSLSIILYSLGIIFGPVTSLIFVITGVGMGYYYAYGKNTDPDGNSYYIFKKRTRFIGRIMFYGGIPLVLAGILFFHGSFYSLYL